jgi:hypothetical protein
MEKKNIIISVIVALIFALLIYAIYYLTKGEANNNNDNKTTSEDSSCMYNPPTTTPTVSTCDQELYAPPPPEIEYTNKKQVFNIGNNIFTYGDAPAVCRAYGAKLATYDQMKEAYDEGANWCNYGWTVGQMALYPTQYKSWKKIQSGPEKYRKSCGKPGLNGGYFENSNLKFGVNCYGKKPETDKSNTDIECPLKYLDEETVNFNNKVDEYKTKLDDYTILPFNKKEWSD